MAIVKRRLEELSTEFQRETNRKKEREEVTDNKVMGTYLGREVGRTGMKIKKRKVMNSKCWGMLSFLCAQMYQRDK